MNYLGMSLIFSKYFMLITCFIMMSKSNSLERILSKDPSRSRYLRLDINDILSRILLTLELFRSLIFKPIALNSFYCFMKCSSLSILDCSSKKELFWKILNSVMHLIWDRTSRVLKAETSLIWICFIPKCFKSFYLSRFKSKPVTSSDSNTSVSF